MFLNKKLPDLITSILIGQIIAKQIMGLYYYAFFKNFIVSIVTAFIRPVLHFVWMNSLM